MRQKGLISAIMPTYNRADFLEGRIYDILNQTYEDWELIIVDDGSTDGTTDFINSNYDDQRISVITLPENSGSVSIPRAVGLFKSRGEFIAHVDDDVENYLDKFEILVNAIGDKTLCYGDRFTTDMHGNIQRSSIPDWNPLAENGWGVDGGQFIYRASIYDTVPIKFPKRGCDWEVAKQARSLGEFAYVPTIISHYVFHGKNRSLDESTKTKEIYPEKYKEYFVNEDGWKADIKTEEQHDSQDSITN